MEMVEASAKGNHLTAEASLPPVRSLTFVLSCSLDSVGAEQRREERRLVIPK